MKTRVLLATVLALSSFGVAASDAWRWVDPDGTVHYGDKPRHAADHLEVKPASGKGPDPDQLARIAECDRQKDELAKLKAATRLRETDALGRTREYTEEEKQQYIGNAEQAMYKACDEAKKSR